MNELKSSVRARSLFLISFGIFWTLISVAVLIVPLEHALTNPQEGGLEPYLILVLGFAGMGLAITAAGVYPWIAWLRVTRPEIVLDKPALIVGDTFTVSYSQNFKRRAEVRGIHLILVMRESAHHSAGKNSYTLHHETIVSGYDHPGQTFEAGDALAFSRPIDIPKDGMHTFHGGNNSIDWALKAKVDIAGWPDYEDTFGLQVQPPMNSPGAL